MAKPPMMYLKMQRAITLLDIVIEDLNSADLDITLHKRITELHKEVVAQYDKLRAIKEHDRIKFLEMCGSMSVIDDLVNDPREG